MPTKRIDAPPLIGGPYAAPRCRVGRPLACLLRGDVEVDGMTEAPVPWPYTRHRGDDVPKSAWPMLIICGDLELAIRTESVRAVAYHWGVTANTVFRWRRALGVERMTEGTARLLSTHAHAKLTKLAPKVPAIRTAIAEGKSNRQIVRELRVPRLTVWRIRTGRFFVE